MFIFIFGPWAHLWRVSNLGFEPCPFLFAYLFYSSLLSRYVLIIYFVFILRIYLLLFKYHVFNCVFVSLILFRIKSSFLLLLFYI